MSYTPREYAEGLRNWARGDHAMTAAVELLIEDGRWLARRDFQEFLIPFPVEDGLSVGLDLERLPSGYTELTASASERFLLKTAVSLLGVGVELDLSDIVGADTYITKAVCTALIQAAGKQRCLEVVSAN